ncbi:MAG: EcsC family protein [Anaerotignaceae bacterium]
MKVIVKELQKIEKAEERLKVQAKKKNIPLWRTQLEEKIPSKVMYGLQKAFSTAFYIVFEKGTTLIEKTYDKDILEKDFKIKDFAMNLKGGRKEIIQIKNNVFSSNALNTVITTVEGIGLGVFGIGLPDIVIWVGVLLKGVYETALKYGFSYDSPEERIFILKTIETAMLTGEDWEKSNKEIDQFILKTTPIMANEVEMKNQIETTANAFATEMLVTKFIQGLPIVGVIGGATNPIYYQKIMQYVQLKYRKRYLINKQTKDKI